MSIGYEKSFQSYIVFGDNSRFGDISVYSEDVKIVKRKELIPVLYEHFENLPDILSESRVDKIYETLKKRMLHE